MRHRPRSIAGLLLALARIYTGRFDARRFVRVFVGGLLLLVVWVIWTAAGSRCASRGSAYRAHAGLDASDGPPINLAVAPAIVWTGSQYGVAWIDMRDRATEVYFARVDRAGLRIGTTLRVTERATVKALPHVAWSGRDFLITWTEVSGSDSEIMVARVTASGERAGAVTPISSEPGRDFAARAAWNGSQLGVAWLHVESRTEYGLRFVRLDAEGRRLGGVVDLRTRALLTGSPDVAADGASFAVAFNEFRLRTRTTTTQIVNVDPDGRAGEPAVVSSRPGVSAQVAMALREGAFGVAWRDDIAVDHSTVAFAVVGPSGPISSRTPLTDGRRYAGNPTVSVGDDGFGVAYEANVGGLTSVHFVALSDSGVPRGVPRRITTHTGFTQSPDLAWNGHDHAVVWCDNRSRGPAIYFARLDRDGVRIGDETSVSSP